MVWAFHGLAALALAIFLAGVVGRVRFWLNASPRSARGVGRLPAAALSLARRGLGAVLRPQALRALFWNGLVLRQVWRESRLRWLIHFSLSWSLVALFTVGSLGNMASDLGAPLEKDDAWFASFNDSVGLLLLAGLILALGRRYISSQRHVRTSFDDASLLVILVLLAVGGYLLEAARYLDEGTPASAGGYAFLGYPLSRAARPLGWDWAAVYDWLWWTHSLLALGLVAYVPYSKLFHMFASPLTIALEAGDADAPGAVQNVVEGEATAWPA